MRRVVLSLLSAAAALLATTSAVLATPPTREPLGLPEVIEFAAGEACPFAVTVEVLVDNGKVMTFYDRTGEVRKAITSGSLVVRLTSPDAPGMEVTLNISGPSHQTFNADGTSTLVYGGNSISLYPPGTLVLTKGRAVVQLDADGNFVSVTNIGWETDVCDMLVP